MTGALADRMGWVGRLIGAGFGWLERLMLRKSDAVVVITDDFSPILRRWRVDHERIAVIPNWAPLEEIPELSHMNSWAAEYGLDGKFLFVYSGTIGHKHRPDLLLRIAQEIPEATVLVVSEGHGADLLRAQRVKSQTINLIQLPFQPYDRLPEVLAAADVLIGHCCIEPSRLCSDCCTEAKLRLNSYERSRNTSSVRVPQVDLASAIRARDLNATVPFGDI